VQRTSHDAAHAQPAARLLVELRALERQRCGNALLGRYLRLGARLSPSLVHLGTTARSARHYVCDEQDGRFQMLQLISITIANAVMRMTCKPASLLVAQTVQQCMATQGSAAKIPHAAHA